MEGRHSTAGLSLSRFYTLALAGLQSRAFSAGLFSLFGVPPPTRLAVFDLMSTNPKIDLADQ